MAEAILMPRLSDTMTEGVIAAWHKNVGDAVKKGDLLAEVETDKATMELESYQDGILLHIGTPTGGKLQVNDLLAIFGKSGEDISALIAKSSGEKNNKSEESTENTSQLTPQTMNPSTIDVSSMEEVVLMPRLSDTMTEGVIAGWHKNVGDAVKKGEVLADIETDKATMELESYKDGILLYQGAKAGDKILVNELLCIIGKQGLDIQAIVAGVKAGTGKASSEEPTSEIKSTSPSSNVSNQVSASSEEVIVNDGRIQASPLAKKIAAEKGIDLRYVKGTGDNGRITKSDIDSHTPTSITSSAPVSKNPLATQTVSQEGFDEVPVSQMRKVIAKRLSENDFVRHTSKNNSHLGRNVSNWLDKKKVFPHNVIVFEEEHRLYLSNLFESAVEASSTTNHSAVFPIELPTWFMKLFTKEGDTILDPFMGSGSTAVAAILSRRNFLGTELEAGYVKEANANIEEVETEVLKTKKKSQRTKNTLLKTAQATA